MANRSKISEADLGLLVLALRTSGDSEVSYPKRTCRDRKSPTVQLGEMTSEPWASANLVGARHRFEIIVSGRERCVDELAKRLANDLSASDYAAEGTFVAEIELLDTDILIDGEGNSAARLTFEALSLAA